MKPDPYNCRHDAEQEAIEEAARLRHEQGECDGAPGCGDCLDEQERGEQSFGG